MKIGIVGAGARRGWLTAVAVMSAHPVHGFVCGEARAFDGMLEIILSPFNQLTTRFRHGTDPLFRVKRRSPEPMGRSTDRSRTVLQCTFYQITNRSI